MDYPLPENKDKCDRCDQLAPVPVQVQCYYGCWHLQCRACAEHTRSEATPDWHPFPAHEIREDELEPLV